MRIFKRANIQIIFFLSAFLAGAVVGAWSQRVAAAQNKYGQPKTVLHVVVYQWKNTVSEDDKQHALEGIKTMAGKIPGIKNIWVKTQRNQIRDFDGVYAIEFSSPEAAADYAESPVHETWSKRWEQLRENSLSFQVSNP